MEMDGFGSLLILWLREIGVNCLTGVHGSDKNFCDRNLAEYNER